jgi:hypothetical protein
MFLRGLIFFPLAFSDGINDAGNHSKYKKKYTALIVADNDEISGHANTDNGYNQPAYF